MKTHPRQKGGGRSTDPDDYPAEKSVYVRRAPERLCQQASELGPRIGEFATRLLAGPVPWSSLRQAQKLLRLAERYTPERLESACARALAFDLLDVKRVERILVEAIDRSADASNPISANADADGLASSPPALDERATEPSPLPPARFARPGSAFARRPDPTEAQPTALTPRGELVAAGGAAR